MIMAVSTPAMPQIHTAPAANASFYEKLNSRWHERALQVFMFIVLAHWGEHLVQAYQIYVMGWPRPEGQWHSWTVVSLADQVRSAALRLCHGHADRHLGAAQGIHRRLAKWWTVALVIQFWHHIEHFLLIWQATSHHNFWGKPVPCSVLQLVFPRVELHLFYNSMVFIPMVIAMYYHMFPSAAEERTMVCTCAVGPQALQCKLPDPERPEYGESQDRVRLSRERVGGSPAPGKVSRISCCSPALQLCLRPPAPGRRILRARSRLSTKSRPSLPGSGLLS